jgi:glycosyl transferase family 25
MKLFNFVDSAFYINLAHRIDKRNLMEQQLKNLGIEHFFKRLNAVSPAELDYSLLENGKYPKESYGKGCFYSHIKAIKYAKENNLKNILVLEDDALFYKNESYDVMKILQKAFDQISCVDNWEIFYLGANSGTRNNSLLQVADNVVKIDEAICTHALVYNSSIFDCVLKEYASHTDADIYFSNRFKNKYMAYPMCVIQRCDVLNDIGWVNYGGCNEQFWKESYNKILVKS